MSHRPTNTKPRTIAPFLTTADVALRLNTTLRHVYRLIDRRRDPLPAHRVGAYLRIDSDELLEWWQRQAMPTTSLKAVRR